MSIPVGPPDPDRELGLVLDDWLSAEAPVRARPEVLERVLSRTATSRQASRVGGRFPGSWLGMPRRLSVRVQLAITAVTVIAIVGGLTLAERQIPGLFPTPRTPLASLSFTRLPASTVFGGAEVNDVIAGGAGLIALGNVKEGGRQSAAIWSSPDGMTWHRDRAPGDSAPLPVPDLTYSMNSTMRLAASGSRVVALLVPACTITPLDCARLQRIWVTDDGGYWTDETAALGACPGECALYQLITVAPPGVVVAGLALNPRGDGLGAITATSTDGIAWTTRHGNGFAAANVTAMAGGRNGLVLIGEDVSGSPGVWTSTDYATWQSVPASSAPSSGQLADVVGGGSGYVAVGRDGGGASSWSSSDGRSWRQATTDPRLAGAMMTRVIRTGLGLVALGSASDGNGAAWYSPDGLAWTQLQTGPVFTGGAVQAAAAVGSRLVLFGTDQRGATVVMVGG